MVSGLPMVTLPWLMSRPRTTTPGFETGMAAASDHQMVVHRDRPLPPPQSPASSRYRPWRWDRGRMIVHQDDGAGRQFQRPFDDLARMNRVWSVPRFCTSSSSQFLRSRRQRRGIPPCRSAPSPPCNSPAAPAGRQRRAAPSPWSWPGGRQRFSGGRVAQPAPLFPSSRARGAEITSARSGKRASGALARAWCRAGGRAANRVISNSS